jgi:hypothetical protein
LNLRPAVSVCSCRSSFLIFGFTIAESGWPSTRFLISAQEHEPRHPDFIFSAAWSSILLPDSFFPVVPSVCISVVTLLRVSVSVGRVLLPSFPLVLATSRARKPPGLGLLSAVSVRAGVSRVDFSCFQSHQVAISRVDYFLASVLWPSSFCSRASLPGLGFPSRGGAQCLISFATKPPLLLLTECARSFSFLLDLKSSCHYTLLVGHVLFGLLWFSPAGSFPVCAGLPRCLACESQRRVLHGSHLDPAFLGPIIGSPENTVHPDLALVIMILFVLLQLVSSARQRSSWSSVRGSFSCSGELVVSSFVLWIWFFVLGGSLHGDISITLESSDQNTR